ncbi:MAG TPA: bifunctional 5,10-methylenetetrahydrofolate dehydrogenase/5,10-methenyltetrahydrofolate cyclohydrolase [Candidatus Dormibacteraeota bacterium]|nr:bifunctional 5,10-methylenetetrahydrofolate dehydrogenase/5,10-methenyltetrahydrofolate cyclohydrolase [Candidatus Dormibacteraeota bacterium]
MAVIDLSSLVDDLRRELATRVAGRRRGYRLGMVLEAGNAAGGSFARALDREAVTAGIAVDRREVAGGDPDATLLALDALVVDPTVDGVVVMQPVRSLSPGAIAAHLPASKDVEAITPTARAQAADGLHRGTPVAEACVAVLEHLGVDCARSRVLIVGHGPSGGRPITQRLLAAGAQVSVVQQDIARVAPVPPYDVLVTAVGRAGVIPPQVVHPGATVLDVGTAFVDGRLVGDVGPEAAARAARVTPVPGGVGRITAICALLSLTELAGRVPGPVASWSLLETAARVISPRDPAGGAAVTAITGALGAALDGLCRLHGLSPAIAESGGLAARLLLAADRDRTAFGAYQAATRAGDPQAIASTRAAALAVPGEIASALGELVDRLAGLQTSPALDLDRTLALQVAEAARTAVLRLQREFASQEG